ncbi:hypothetical protein KBX06_16730 [Micromonospora sp. C31]|uniref:hypothetical protein n=1 Tax=Micromonospora sp. C31 TaxID=2824876 RepID=UPI001B369633|nr:hypothetical protein [Micromonospora sp. C31]MBQ1074801.1 hypothetical protein [Micromonospora sp. C31]
MDQIQIIALVYTVVRVVGWCLDRGSDLVALPHDLLTRWYEASMRRRKARAEYHAEADRLLRDAAPDGRLSDGPEIV